MPDGKDSLQDIGDHSSVERKKAGEPPARFIAFWISVLTFAAIYTLLYGADSGRQLLISLTTDQRGEFQVFFDHGAGFSEQDSSRIVVRPGSHTYSIRLTEEPLSALRLDPDPTIVRMRLDTVVIQDRRSAHSATLRLTDLSPLNEIASIGPDETGATVVTAPNAQDPQTLLPVHEEFAPRAWELVIGRACRGLLLLTLGFAVVFRMARPSIGVPVSSLIFGAWMLVAAMAFTSPTSQSVHPDEFSHLAAARYYYSHWIPPRADSPEIIGSYSAYGASYLNELDIVYPIAAKVSQLWEVFGLEETTSLRLFNVLLFGGLLGIAAIFQKSWPTVVVLLLTPQVWYVFSYFNADALALFLSLVATMMYAAPHSPVSRFIEGERVSRAVLFVFVVALGMLAVSKRNYLPVVFITAFFLAARHLQITVATAALGAAGVALLLLKAIAGAALFVMFPRTAAYIAPAGVASLAVFSFFTLWSVVRRPTLRPRLYRLATIFALALAVALPRVIVDIAINGSPGAKSIRMSAVAEERAQLPFKPSTVASNPQSSYPGLALAAKGVTLSEVVGTPYEWFASSWRSFLGVYGYMSVYAPPILYSFLAAAFTSLCFCMAIWAFVHPGARAAFGVAVAGTGLVILGSIVQSWANDLQGQGRYLFPVLAMMAAYLQSQPELSRSRFVAVSISACFCGSTMSFLTVALPAFVNR